MIKDDYPKDPEQNGHESLVHPDINYTPPLTQEQLGQLASAAQIDVYGACHGIVGPETHMPTTDREYDEAAKVALSLTASRGDALFVEDPGLRQQKKYNKLLSLPPMNVLAAAEIMRATKAGDAFEYAAYFAIARGVPVMSADIDPDRMAQLGGYAALSDLTQAHKIAHPLREQAAVDRLLTTGHDKCKTLEPSDEKSHFALLFGSSHVTNGGLEKAFTRAGLTKSAYEIHLLESDMLTRYATVAIQGIATMLVEFVKHMTPPPDTSSSE